MCSLEYTQVILALKKKMQKTAQKRSETAQNCEIYMKVYTVSYYYCSKTLPMFSYCQWVFSTVYTSVFSCKKLKKYQKNGPKMIKNSNICIKVYTVRLGCFILGVMFEVNKTQPLVGPNGLKMKYGMGLTPRGMPKKLLGPKNTCELAETEIEVWSISTLEAIFSFRFWRG